MSDTKELFELAQLAEASYALLENAVNNATETIAALRAPIAESIGSDSIDSVIKPKIFLERK